jgi:elongation factor P--beta-lysine ligase
VSFPQVGDQTSRDALLAEAAKQDPDVAETLELFAAGIEAFAAASVEVWEPPTRVSNTSTVGS